MSSRRLFFVVLACLALTAGTAFAAQGGGGNTSTAPSSITLNGTAAFGQTASFTAIDPPVKYTIQVGVFCTQGGKTVFGQVRDMSGSSPYHPQFTLYSDAWAASGGGSANCTASEYYYTWQGKTETGVVSLANTSFTAAG